MRIATTINRLLCAALTALALVVPLGSAFAADYTDIWFNPAESGWGVNLVQSNAFIFATFFIYAADGKPTWLIATLSYDGSSKYSGAVSSVVGSYYAGPWNPPANPETVVGTATFQPSTSNNWQGTLTYSVIGVGTVTKAIQRQPLTTALFSGNYYGGESGGYSGCTNSADNLLFTDSFPLAVTQTASTLSLVFAYEGLNATCTLAGGLAQNGLLYSIPAATYTCTDGLSTTAAISDIKQTAQGIEGKITAPVPGGCLETTRFSAVRQ